MIWMILNHYASSVMVIGHGHLLYDGKLEGLKKQYAPLRRIRATLAANIKEFQIEGAESIKVEGNTWTVMFDPMKIAAHNMVERLAQRLPLKDISIEEENIDEIIASMYKEMCL